MTTDHDEIRRWAEERGARPSCVRGTGGGGDTGLLRLDFPGYSGGKSLQEIDWDDFFEKFDEQNLALVYQNQTKDGRPSNFNKLVDRNDSRGGRNGGGGSRGGSSRSGGSRGQSSSGSKSSGRSGGSSSRSGGSSARSGSTARAGSSSSRGGSSGRHGRSAR
jgi:hypothetical protein